MNNIKTYLNVSYAQKDAVKALGARWDPANKKWYVPANIDITLFAAWRLDSVSVEPEIKTLRGNDATNLIINTDKNAAAGVITYPADKNFVAYDGQVPPWD